MRTRFLLAAVLAAAAPAAAQRGPGSPYPAPDGRTGPGGRMGGGPAVMIRQADANGDGVVTREEYLAAVDARFARMDRNGDGVLAADEMPRFGGRGGHGRGVGGVPGPNGGTLPSGYADAGEAAPSGANPAPPPPNGASANATGTPPSTPTREGERGGAMTRDQYREQAMRRFERWDTNGDGKIDQAELAAVGGRRDGPPGGQ